MSVLRIGVGGFWHESNSFCPVPTSLDDFASYSGILVGNEVLASERRDEVSGAVSVLGRNDRCEVVGLVSSEALPAGHITDDAVDHLTEVLRLRLREAGRLDGICFALHGAMTGQSTLDLDGHFLRILREEAGGEIPLVCSLDCHAVVTRQMVDLADAMVAYRTHPHEDVVETGIRAADILLDILKGRTKPVMRCRKIPMLFFDGGIESGPLRDIFDRFIAWDKMDGVVACSLCPSFSWQDVPEQGWAALAVTNDDAALAERLAMELADVCWKARHELLPKPMISPEEAIRQAAATPGCPVVITDPADNVGGGGGGDNTVLLEALLRLRGEVEGLVLHHIPDPEATAVVKESKVGETVTVKVGGKRDFRFSKPVSVTGQVLCVTEGPITDDGGFTAKALADTGAIVLLGIDNVRLVLTDRLVHGPQPSLFRKVGVEPFDAKIVAVKSGIGYRVTYGHVAKAVIVADCPGALSGNLNNYDFQRIPRPIFPIDGNFDWKADAQDGVFPRGKEK